MARIFFALWPQPSAAERLARVALDLVPACGGRPIPAERIHLTLAFLGEIPEGRIAAARSIAPAGEPFTAQLDCVGSFRAARVAWAGATRPAGELLRLQAELAAGLRARGFALEDRPFAPHLTLVRGIARPLDSAPMEPICWRVDEAALVRSEGGRYTMLAVFPLAGGGR